MWFQFRLRIETVKAVTEMEMEIGRENKGEAGLFESEGCLS